MTEERLSQIAALDYISMRRAIAYEPMSDAQRLSLEPAILTALVKYHKRGQRAAAAADRRECVAARGETVGAPESAGSFTPIAIAPGAPTERAGRVATLGRTYVKRALEACRNTDEERAYFEGLMAKWWKPRRDGVSNSDMRRKRLPWTADMAERVRVTFPDGNPTEPKGHMAELADGWMPDWVKVPT